MATFRWKARTSEGRQIEGEITAPSRDEVLERLRGQGLMVTEVVARPAKADDSAASGPEVPLDVPHSPRPSLRDRLRRERVATPWRPFRGLLIAAVFVLAALGAGSMAPVVVCECERLPDGSVDCSVKDRLLGVFTLRDQRLARVESVETETKTWTVTGTRTSGGRTSYTSDDLSQSRLVLHDRLGNSVRPAGWDRGGTLGTPADEMKAAVETLLADATPARISMWRGDWLSVYVPGACLLIAVLMFAAISLSLFKGSRDWIDRRVDALADVADRHRGIR